MQEINKTRERKEIKEKRTGRSKDRVRHTDASLFRFIAAIKVAISWEKMASFPRLETASNIHPRGEVVPYIGSRSSPRKQLPYCEQKWNKWTLFLVNLWRYFNRVRSEIITAVVMKTSVFWDITPRKFVEGKRMFQRDISLPYSGSISMGYTLL